MKQYVLKNLDCPNCAMQLESALKKLPYVKDVNVSFASSRLSIDTDDMDGVICKIRECEPDVEVIDKSDRMKKNQANDNENKNLKRELILIGAYIFVFLGAAGHLNFAIIKAPILNYFAYAALFVVYLLAGGSVILSAFKNILRGKVFDENFLMTFATIAAFCVGAYTEGVAVMLFYKVGEFFQELAVKRSRNSIKALLEVRPDHANILRDGDIIRVMPEDVKVGEIIVVKPGEKIPLDGLIIKGRSSVDKKALTGESVPESVNIDDTVLAGAINLTGLIEVKTTKLYADSSVAKILDIVENAASNKAKTENFITVFAKYYTPIVFVVAAAVAILPPLLDYGSFSEWVYRALVVLVVSCPCALVISIPLGYFGGIGAASRNGILVKGANYLEALSNVKSVAFDKTGTLTKGVFKVLSINARNGFSEDDVIKYAAFAESRSNHPIALSIVKAYGRSFDQNDILAYEELAGHGVTVEFDGQFLLAGNDRMLHKFNIEHHKSECEIEGAVAHIAIDGVYAGNIVIGDELKSEVNDALKNLRTLGVDSVAVLTGDNKSAAAEILSGLDIDHCYSDLLPEDKAEVFKRFKSANSSGKSVFIGDGVNDAPVLALSDIGISMGALGSDAAIETADVVIMDDSLLKIPKAISIAKKTKLIIWQNIIFALTVKALFIALGFFGIATMWEAVFADVGVALIALFNSMRLVWNVDKKQILPTKISTEYSN